MKLLWIARLLSVLLALCGTCFPAEPRKSKATKGNAAAKPVLREPDVGYLPTSQLVVDEILRLVPIKAGDVVYDLGCGDGRFVITAAKNYGARGVGIDLDPERIRESKANAETAGVPARVTFRQGDLFEADIREATVVILYLLPDLNQKLRPKLLAELRPGTRVVSHYFDMGSEWPAEKVLEIQGRKVYLWTIPERAAP
jgi:ribosomal protein L11 methylase PrmA